MAEESRLAEKVTEDVRQYVRMKTDAVKLSLVANLSAIAGGALALIICLLFCLLAMMMFTGAAVYGLNLLIDSMLWSTFIIGAVYAIIGIIIFYKREMFYNKMVRVFSRMFFENGDNK